MSNPCLCDFPQESPAETTDMRKDDKPLTERRPTDEMSRILKTKPIHMALDPTGGAITQWLHDPVHDVVGPMADHVIMTFPTGSQRFERRTGKIVTIGTARPGVMTIVPAGSTSRWDIPEPLNCIQLYLPHTTLVRVANEANIATPGELIERTAHPDPITSRLLVSAADVLDGHEALDTLFRQQLTDLLATRLLSAHTGRLSTYQPALGGLSPTVLRRSIERLRSDADMDVSLAALAADAGLSRFHFCRAFKESTGLSPHNWLRQHRLEQAMSMLRDPGNSVAIVAAALGYASQTAFAAAFRKLTGDTPSDWRRRNGL